MSETDSKSQFHLDLPQEPWSVVREEMVAQKGLDPAVADKIEPYVKLKGTYVC